MDVIILVGLLVGALLLFSGATGKPKPKKPEPRRPPPISTDYLVDAIADQARSLSDDGKKQLIKAIARQIKRSKLRS